jgi:hypothetical protein
MKKYYFLLIISMITVLFADTIIYEKHSAFGSNTYYLENIVFEGISLENIYFTFIDSDSKSDDPNVLGKLISSEISSEGGFKSISTSYDNVISIENVQGNQIDFDFNDDATLSNKFLTDSQKTLAYRIGGCMVFVGAWIIYDELSKECGNCVDWQYKDFIDESRKEQKIGYILIGVGGLLIALGA